MSEIAERTPQQELVSRIRGPEFQQQVALALPNGMNPDRFVRVMATALLDNPDLATKADANSIFQSGLKAAQDGLLPNGDEAAFVIFKGECVYIPMIAGYRKIAAEFGWSIRTNVVREGDEFDFELGDSPQIRHRPSLSDGEVIAAYAVGVDRGGRREIEVMGRDEIEKVRATSRAAEKGPWVEWFGRMAEKTVGRRLFKKLPLGDRERIERVAAASEIGPAESAALLYGERARDAFPARELEDGSGADGQAADGPQAEPRSEGSRQPSPLGAPPASDEPEWSGEEPPPAEAESTESKSEDEIVAAAGAVSFASGRHKGRTIRQVHEDRKDGAYVVWASNNWNTQRVKDAAMTYAKAKGLS